MPLRRLGGVEAMAVYRANPYSDWPTRDEPDNNRLRPVCKPAFCPSFRLEYGEKVFTIGSCFARNIEKALSVRGFDVVTANVNWPDSSAKSAGNSVLNNYGLASIVNDLRWALDPAHPFEPDLHVVEILPNRFLDLHVAVHAAPYQTVMAYRNAITEVTRRVKECRVVVMTLGLAELWFDNFSGCYLNRTPPRMLISRQPERFEVHLLSMTEAMDMMRTAMDLLRTYCRPDLRVLLTVSPVPLAASFFENDNIVTNCYSKSVLRAVAEHAAVEYAMVDYFPSYESVMLSDAEQAWMSDQRHVQDGLVAINVERMIQAYRPEGAVADERAIKTALELAEQESKVKNFAAALSILEPFSAAAVADVDFAVTYADLCIRAGRISDAERVVMSLPAAAGGWRAAMLRAQLRLARGEDATASLAVLAEKGPGRARILRILVEAYVEFGRYEDALAAAGKWLAVMENKAEPLRKIASIHIKRGDAAAAEGAFKMGGEQSRVTPVYVMDYGEFLIQQGRLTEAAEVLRNCIPEMKSHRLRLDQLRVLLPSFADHH